VADRLEHQPLEAVLPDRAVEELDRLVSIARVHADVGGKAIGIALDRVGHVLQHPLLRAERLAVGHDDRVLDLRLAQEPDDRLGRSYQPRIGDSSTCVWKSMITARSS
jgi:hypothetical protein